MSKIIRIVLNSLLAAGLSLVLSIAAGHTLYARGVIMNEVSVIVVPLLAAILAFIATIATCVFSHPDHTRSANTRLLVQLIVGLLLGVVFVQPTWHPWAKSGIVGYVYFIFPPLSAFYFRSVLRQK
jgi:hypothetical protein